jgi:nitrogenase molybdenum-iron protein alpha/beta subunit
MMEDPGRYSAPVNFPSLLGVYLAVNAISDAYVLVDGPDCALYKAHFLHGRHDWSSSLLRTDGRHRVAFTNVCASGVVREHDAAIGRAVKEISALESAGGLFLTGMPLCSITGIDYGRILNGLGATSGKPTVDIPPSSLVGDWLDGYEQALAALASRLDLPSARRRPGTAAVVGYLMDRNEADHAANLAEVRRMLEAAGLEAVSIWLDGSPVSALADAAEAEFVISLPYGRRAARIVAERTGARLIEADLPFGLPRSAAFVRKAAAAAGKETAAESFIDRELAIAARRLQWVLPRHFVGRTASFIGDPHLLEGFFDIAEDSGFSVERAIVTHGRPPANAPEGLKVLCEPPCQSEEVRASYTDTRHFLVSCSFQHWRIDRPYLEFGFPSYRHHALFERPFLGFRGCLGFLDRLAEVVAPGSHV